MRGRWVRWAWLGMLIGAAAGQTLDNRSLNGKYFFRHVLVTTDASGAVNGASSLLGAITFNGSGQYSFVGQQTAGTSPAVSQTGSGTYFVDPGGIVSIGNPLRSGLSINARYSATAVIGSSTEPPDNVFDLFVAIPAPISMVTNASLNGPYWVSTLEFPGANSASIRNAFFNLQANGQGSFSNITVSGHAANLGDRPTTQTVTGATYSLTGDGSGTVNFGASQATALLSGAKNIYLSQDAGVLLGGSTTPGAHDILIAVKSGAGPFSSASWKDRFWIAGMRFEPAMPSSYAGSLYANGVSKLSRADRVHAIGLNPAIDFTGANSYTMRPDGSGTSLQNPVAVAASGNSFVGSGVSQDAYELFFGVRLPALTGPGVFLNPLGVGNGGSLAATASPISPGEFVALFGTGLAGGPQTAPPPYPPSLGGVQVLINNRPAPLYLVSPTQINALVPYATQGPRAAIVVVNNGARSNEVSVPVARTTPGVFSLESSGTGPGAILHLDFSVVSASNPARRGEIVAVFLTGMGAVNPPVPDGTAGGSSPVSVAVTPTVFVGGVQAEVLYSGLAPGFPGLYQLNVRIPVAAPAGNTLPLAIQTAESFHDQVDLLMQ